MTQTIEAFVNQLQDEGIQAGQAAANKIRVEAEQEARRVLDAAETQAHKAVESARAECARIRSRTENELILAARDTVARLQETLSGILKEILVRRVNDALANSDFIKQVLHDIVVEFARADVESQGVVVLNVSEQMRHQLAEWAIQEFHKNIQAAGRSVDLKGTLAGAGFEYKLGDGTAEVTTESVVEVLTGLVGPELRKIIARAAAAGVSTQ
ncbi:MAG TPA: hypothetical protein VLM89_07325 [Phycisphaerae bacterium]|nr:hypothetical protein [Phycisphaerae bacterium]